MLESLDDIPWSSLEHAYGDAGDIPNLLRALNSSDPDQREWAQEMLDMGPFHQGSLYSCTPFVVRVLLQLAQENDAADLPWIVRYVSRVLASALWWLSDSEVTAQDSEVNYAAQILLEIRGQWPVLLSLLDHPDSHVRLALLRLLALLKDDAPQLGGVLAEKLGTETDASLRAAMVFCLSLVADASSLLTVQGILEDAEASPLERIAAGFGGISVVKEQATDEMVEAFCELIAHNDDALNQFEEIYSEYLSPLGVAPGNDRLLECLRQDWSSHQRVQIVQALLSIYARLPMVPSAGVRFGSGYYLEAMVRLAFPEGRLPCKATVRDLNDIQRRVLEAFQQYDMPMKPWNVYSSSDFRTLLGFDFRTEADFLSFMSGERSALQTNQ